MHRAKALVLAILISVLSQYLFADHGNAASVGPKKWQASYFANFQLQDPPHLTREEESAINYQWRLEPLPGMPKDYFSVRWTGSFEIVEDGLYLVKFSTNDGMRVYINDSLIDYGNSLDREMPLLLKKGNHTARVEFFQSYGMGRLSFDIVSQFGKAVDTATISGTVKLPRGVKATSDKTVYIAASDSSGRKWYGYALIPAGAASAPYRVLVPHSGNNNFILSYETTPDSCSPKGYYSSAGVVADIKSAGSLVLSGRQMTGVDLQLTSGPRISGTISVPDGGSAPAGGLSFLLKILKQDSDEYSLSMTIPAGKSSVPYSIVVPPYAGTNLYRISYTAEYDRFMNFGFFYSDKRTIANPPSAEWVRVTDKDVQNINFSFIVGGVISGIVSLENDAQAKEDINLSIEGLSIGHPTQEWTRYKTRARIVKGDNSAAFAIKLPADFEENTYYLRYVVSTKGLQRVGYYAEDGTLTIDEATKAERFDIRRGHHPGISLIVKNDATTLSPVEETALAQQKVKEIVTALIKPEMTDFEKTLVLHDYLCLNSEYGWYNAASSLYTILVKGLGECAAHGRAMYELLTAAGVESKRVPGIGHVWNMVKIDGKFYHLDATANDRGGDRLVYTHFLLTDAQLTKRGNTWVWNRSEYPTIEEPFIFTEKHLPNRELVKNNGFYRIIGNIKLPDGMRAGAGGIGVRLWSSYFHIPEGKNSTAYMVTYHKSDKDAESTMTVTVDSSEYASGAYVGKSGLTVHEKDAILFKRDRTEDMLGLDILLGKREELECPPRKGDGNAAINFGNGKIYFFKGPNYISYDIKNDRADLGFPKPIEGNWPGLWPEGIDAAINWQNGKAYFFRGTEYVRFDIASHRVDNGYPKPIKGNWPGMCPDGVDDAIVWKQKTAYFFRGPFYWSYELGTGEIDERRLEENRNFPKPIKGNWRGLELEHTDSAVELDGKLYFFVGNEYYRFDESSNRVPGGYPRSTIQNWKGVSFP